MSTKDAFLFLQRKQSRPMQFYRPGNSPVMTLIGAAPSNYQRNLAGPGDTAIIGREFVLSYDEVKSAGLSPVIKRGDRLIDPDLGDMAVDEVIDMYDLGGAIIGFRVRMES